MNDSPGRPSPGSEDAGAPDPGEQRTPGLPGQAQPPAAEQTGGTEPVDAPAPATDAADGAETAPDAPAGQVPPPPPPPAYGAGPGYGQAPGYGQGPYAWNAPPAPKPGVIPLRPLGIGDIFEGAFATLRRHWRPALSVSAVVSVIMGVGTTLIEGQELRSNAYNALLNQERPTLHQLGELYRHIMVSLSFELIIGLVGQIIATSMLIMLVSRAVLGRPATVGEIWRDALPRMPRLLGLVVVITLVIPCTFGVGIVPGLLVAAAGSTGGGLALALLGGAATACVALWLWISFSLAPPALVLERQGVFASLARSFKLVRGAWWRIFGILILAAILSYVVSGVMQAVMGAFTSNPVLSGNPFDMLKAQHPFASPGWGAIALMGIGTVISSTVVLPMSAGVTALLYMDQRIRREGLDVELAAAAGVEPPAAAH